MEHPDELVDYLDYDPTLEVDELAIDEEYFKAYRYEYLVVRANIIYQTILERPYSLVNPFNYMSRSEFYKTIWIDFKFEEYVEKEVINKSNYTELFNNNLEILLPQHVITDNLRFYLSLREHTRLPDELHYYRIIVSEAMKLSD